MSVNWFQPFLHTQYSVGALYLTIQNLPRDVRCKEENVILVGVLPGPSEPKLAMNSYLFPLVEELKQGWKGFSVMTSEGVQVNIRVALSCISCMQVGVVQYYFRHRAEVCKGNEKFTVNMDYAYVQKHPNPHWFGHSATICFDMFEPSSSCSFIPVQRIAKKCAFCVLMLEVMPNICLLLPLYA